MATAIRFTSFPLTEQPPDYAVEVVQVFRAHEEQISTTALRKGLKSDEVLAVLRDGLVTLGFQIEAGKTSSGKIDRPVFYGENGIPGLRYQIDGYWPEKKCGIEVEAGRSVMGNAIYRDLVQAMVMVQVDHLVLGVPNQYKYKSSGRDASNPGYDVAVSVARALYGHTRVQIPYGLTVVGY